MSTVFISHVAEDGELCAAIARGLEAQGFATWYYEEHSLPGLSYVDQVLDAIRDAAALVVILSPSALTSRQIDVEIMHAHETGKRLIPVLSNLTYESFRTRKPAWAMILGPAVAMALPADAAGSVPRLVQGLRKLGIAPSATSTDNETDGTLAVSESEHLADPSEVVAGGNAESAANARLDFSRLRQAPAVLVGRSIDAYTILKFIGSGGSGWVYRARHGALGRDACVKILYPLQRDLEGLLRVLGLGIRALAQLDRPSLDMAP